MFFSHPTESSVAALRVFKLRDSLPSPVSSDCTEYKVLAAAASVALDLLQSKKGYRALELTVQGILVGSNIDHLATRSAADFEAHTTTFMKSVLKTFPYLVINDLQAMNARTTRFRWHDEQMHLFGARYAAVIEVNSVLLGMAARAREAFNDGRLSADAFAAYVLRLGITLAHEICHVLTVFLLYDPLIITPADVIYGQAYTVADEGESGRQWEYLTFGGYIDLQGDYWNDFEVIVAVREASGSHVWSMQPKVVRELVKYRNFGCLPLVEDISTFDKSYVRHIEGHHWENPDRYRNIFEGRLVVNQHGGTVHPPTLPQHIFNTFTTIGSYPAAHYIKGSKVHKWISFPRDPNSTEDDFKKVAIPIKVLDVYS